MLIVTREFADTPVRFDPEFRSQFSTATKHRPAIQIMRKCWLRGAVVASTRFREPQISGFVARSRVLDNSGVSSLSLRSLQQFPFHPWSLTNRFTLSQIFYWPMHLPTILRHRITLRRLPRGASYISCTEYNGASSETRQVRRKSGIETMERFVRKISLYIYMYMYNAYVNQGNHNDPKISISKDFSQN